MTFRPFPILSILTAASLVFLVWLGVWQVQRFEWKRGLVADFEQLQEQTLGPLNLALCGSDGTSRTQVGTYEWVPISLDDVRGLVEASRGMAPDVELRMFGRSVGGIPGWRRFLLIEAPACVSDAQWLMVEGEFEAEDEFGGQAAIVERPSAFVVSPWPERPTFLPKNTPEKNTWHWFDADAMEEAFGVEGLSRAVFVEGVGGKPDYLTRTPPVRHIGYAVTWFGMAIGCLIIYIIFHMQAGRLTFRRERHTSE